MVSTGQIAGQASIQGTASQPNAIPPAELAALVAQLRSSIDADSEIGAPARDGLLEQLEVIQEQAQLPSAQRKMGVIRPVLSTLGATLEAAGGAAEVWNAIGPTVHQFFGV